MPKVVSLSSKTPRYISLQDLEDTKETSVYVINTSPKNMRGDVLFVADKPNGRSSDTVRVMLTWIPQDLTELTPRRQLLNSSEFRRTIAKGLIRLVNPAYARKVLETEDAQVEVARLENLRSAARASLQGITVTDIDSERTTARVSRGARAVQEEESSQQGMTQFDHFLRGLEGKGQVEVLNALRNLASFTKKQLKKVIAEFEQFPRVVNYAKKQLEQHAE